MSTERRFAVVAASGALLLLAVLALAIALGAGGSSSDGSRRSSSEGTSGFDGAALPAGVKAPDFRLTDQHGQAVSPLDLRGQTIVLAFTYASCGAPCEVIAQQIRGALDELPHVATVVMISADPRADTPATIRHFLANVSLSGRVLYLTGTAAQLRHVWREYRVTPAKSRKSASAFASATPVLLLDAQGQERVEFGQEQLTAEALAHDIQKLEGDPAHP
jgi:protein SCO1/2